MKIAARIALLAELGAYLSAPIEDDLAMVIQHAYVENQWFTPENVTASLKSIATAFLDKTKLTEWAARYPIADHEHPEKTIALVMAGNIPLVGFHDWLCVFMAGQKAKVKLSDKDKRLLPFLVKKMGEWAHESWEYTEFLLEQDKLGAFDAVIATGSNNTARYFEQYFGKYPHIIRKNRNGIAVLDGSETTEEMIALGKDIFTYFGLGCRNVSKIYVPRGYDFTNLMEALHEYRELAMHNKYKNNFDYNFTLYILNKIVHYNNGCIILTENPTFTSRIASLNFEYYDDLAQLSETLQTQREAIQCIVAHQPLPNLPTLPFGQTQAPTLMDYPDGVDVMDFLMKIQ